MLNSISFIFINQIKSDVKANIYIFHVHEYSSNFSKRLVLNMKMFWCDKPSHATLFFSLDHDERCSYVENQAKILDLL